MKYRTLAIFLFVFFAFTLSAYADQGKVLQILDGDTFLAEVDGKRGKETIEINLRCSDAPVINSSFGPESKKFLAQLLGQAALVSYKVQEFCGSEKCIEALVYFPPEKNQAISYINTQMIEAGMARNNDCRGVFVRAEEVAKAEKSGIWSTSKKIVFSEPTKNKTIAPAPAKTVTKKTVTTEKEAPAVIRYDRAERTVTIKSQKISLSRAIETINIVSPSPIKLYLQGEEYIPINLERTHWYDALRYVVESADLKQVNLDGKIDLYTRLFYYKYVSPHLKIAGNVGVYMNTGSAPQKEMIKDDGTTRYVFINDFENSAEVAQQYRETQARTEGSRDKSSGFIQVHEGSSVAPVSSYGTFERSGQKTAPVQVAATEPVKEVVPTPVEKAAVTPPKPTRAPLKPYSGEKVAVEEEKPVQVAVAPVPVAKKDAEIAAPVETMKAPAAADETQVVVAEKPAPVSEEASKPEDGNKADTEVDKPAAAAPPVTEKPSGAPAFEIEFSLSHAAAIVLIIIVIIIGCIYLTRSAGAKASAAEKHVEPDELEEKEEELSLDIDAQVDKKYEEEIFDEIDHASDPEKVESEDAADETPADESVTETEEPPAVTERDAEESAGASSDSEEMTEIAEEEPAKHEPQALSGKEKRIQPEVQEGEADSEAAGVYSAAEHGPERVPRKICLFEVKCSLDGNSFTGIGLDISAGGLFVDSKEALDIGKVVELEFKLLEDDEESARCRGAVTWYNRRPDPIKPDYPNGFGVRFVDMDPLTLIRINEYLALDDEDS